MNLERVIRDHDATGSLLGDPVNVGSRDRGGRIKTVQFYLQTTEDPEATATHINVSLFGAMTLADVLQRQFTIGTFDETETALNNGLTSTINWSWGQPASGTFLARVLGIRIWPYMYVRVTPSGASSNILNAWLVW